MENNGSADQGRVQGRIVKVQPQGDGTLKFEVVCHNSKGCVAHRQYFLLPQESEQISVVMKGKGKLARVFFKQREKSGHERDRPTKVLLIE